MIKKDKFVSIVSSKKFIIASCIGVIALTSGLYVYGVNARSRVAGGVLNLVSDMSKRCVDGDTSPFIISNTMAQGNETLTYIETFTKDGSYTEIPVNEDGTASNTTFENANNQSYALYDWLRNDGTYFTLSGVSDDSVNWLEYDKSYGSTLLSRSSMHLTKLLDNVDSRDYKIGEKVKMNLGYSEDVEVQLHEFKVDAKTTSNVLSLDTLGLYRSLEKQAKSKGDKDFENYLKKVSDELEESYTCSRGTLTVGVYNNQIRYMSLKASGLGNTVVLTKTLFELEGLEVRSEPSFSNNSSLFYDTLKDAYVKSVSDSNKEETDSIVATPIPNENKSDEK